VSRRGRKKERVIRRFVPLIVVVLGLVMGLLLFIGYLSGEKVRKEFSTAMEEFKRESGVRILRVSPACFIIGGGNGTIVISPSGFITVEAKLIKCDIVIVGPRTNWELLKHVVRKNTRIICDLELLADIPSNLKDKVVFIKPMETVDVETGVGSVKITAFNYTKNSYSYVLEIDGVRIFLGMRSWCGEIFSLVREHGVDIVLMPYSGPSVEEVKIVYESLSPEFIIMYEPTTALGEEKRIFNSVKGTELEGKLVVLDIFKLFRYSG